MKQDVLSQVQGQPRINNETLFQKETFSLKKKTKQYSDRFFKIYFFNYLNVCLYS